VLGNEEKTRLRAKNYIHVQAPKAVMNKKHWHSKCLYKWNSGSPLRRYEQPHSIGVGLWSNRRPTNGAPTPAPAAATTTTSARPCQKLVRQGWAEGCRVGGRSVAGLGYLASGRTSSGCRGGHRHRERLRSHSRPKARHAAAVSAADSDRPSLRSLSKGADRHPRRGRPQLGMLPSPASVMKILEAEGGAEAATRLAFPHHQVGGHRPR
jgi:hypothetical protein